MPKLPPWHKRDPSLRPAIFELILWIVVGGLTALFWILATK